MNTRYPAPPAAWRLGSPWLLAAVFGIVLPAAAPATVPVPAGLGDGAQYQLIFNSSTFTTAQSSNIDTYNLVAQSAADNAGIGSGEGITWRALASTDSVDARDNATVGTSTPVFNMNLDLVATGAQDLWDGSLSAALSWNEQGAPNPFDAWTGTNPDGTAATGLTLGNANGSAWCGRPSFTSSNWINFIQPSLSSPLHIYALSEILTVPVLVGDLNGDGQVNFGDLSPFTIALTDAASYAEDFPTLNRVSRCDTNGDGQCNFGDLSPFAALLSGSAAGAATSSSTHAIPEPGACGLLILGAAAACLFRSTAVRLRPPAA